MVNGILKNARPLEDRPPYYELTKFQHQTPPQSEDRANFVIFWNYISKIALSTVGEPTLTAVT